jgi:hypothetical protein
VEVDIIQIVLSLHFANIAPTVPSTKIDMGTDIEETRALHFVRLSFVSVDDILHAWFGWTSAPGCNITTQKKKQLIFNIKKHSHAICPNQLVWWHVDYS